MSSHEVNADGFVELWPTRLMKRQLPQTDQANQALLALILELESKHQDGLQQGRDLTTDYLTQDLLKIDNPAVKWLQGCINKTVVDYLKSQGVDYDVQWNLQAWANVNRLGDYHNLHNHPHSYLSGTYYVTMPTDAPVASGSRKDLNPGAISFYDPRAQANMTAINRDDQVDPEFRVLPLAGTMLLWPSFLHHFVHPNLSEQVRVSVSFNVVLQWNDSFLPV